MLAAGLLLPELLRLISEEIGERRERAVEEQQSSRWHFSSLYVGARADLHSRAINLLVVSREYRGKSPLPPVRSRHIHAVRLARSGRDRRHD